MNIINLPKIAIVVTSQPNDMVFDTKQGAFIIADEGIGNGDNSTTAP
ncbi:hypothetical protein V1389_09775 [Flavobacterium rakeshii]|nr:hypothetical protein [Flavobacterium rakeshii]MEE1898626.1 hypothetical protein [Flavobacterium rakeshii]